jgi:hypothetical protein
MVKSRFQFAMLGSLERSTCGWTWLLVCCTLKVARRWSLWLGLLYLAIASVDAGEVDFADESDVGRGVGVLRTAVDAEGVDAVLVDALWLRLGSG